VVLVAVDGDGDAPAVDVVAQFERRPDAMPRSRRDEE